MKTITSANAILILTVEELYPSGVQIEKFASDDAFSSDNVAIAEVRMGVDGQLAAGYTPAPIPFKISLEADSDSIEYLRNIANNQRLNKTTYSITASISIPALGKEFTLINGILTEVPSILNAKKVLEPTQWGFTFEDVNDSTI